MAFEPQCPQSGSLLTQGDRHELIPAVFYELPQGPTETINNGDGRQVSTAVGEARRIRPDLFIATLRDDVPVYTSTAMDAQVPMPDMFFLPVVNFVAGRAELRDDQFTTDGRAVTLIQLFAAGIGGRN
jgi:hypothetical protein